MNPPAKQSVPGRTQHAFERRIEAEKLFLEAGKSSIEAVDALKAASMSRRRAPHSLDLQIAYYRKAVECVIKASRLLDESLKVCDKATEPLDVATAEEVGCSLDVDDEAVGWMFVDRQCHCAMCWDEDLEDRSIWA